MRLLVYIRHKFNQIVVHNFVGDEYVGSERKLPLKEKITTSLKKVRKLSAQAKAAVGVAGGPFNRKEEAGEKVALRTRHRRGVPCLRVSTNPKPQRGSKPAERMISNASSVRSRDISRRTARTSRDGILLLR